MGMEDEVDPGPAASSGRAPRYRLRDQPVVLVAIVLVCLPLIVNAVRVGADHYVPTGDNSIIALRAGDVFGDNSPSLGMPSSLSGYTGGAESANHPGPLLFWSLSIPYALSGHSPVGLLVGIVLVEVVSVLAIAWAALRRAGPLVAVLALLAAALLCFSLGGPSLGQPLNPVLVALPFLAFLVLCWGVAAGDAWMLAPAILAGSLCVQAHLSYGVVTAVVGVVAVGSGVVTWVLEARQGDSVRRLRVPLGVAAGVTIVCWVAPLVQQLTSEHPNLSAILGGVGPAGGSSQLPAGTARRFLAATYGLPAVWTGRERWLAPVGPITWATAVALWVALIGLLVWGTESKARRSLLLVAGAAGVGVFATMQFSPNTLDRQSFRYLWAVGPFTWFAVVAGVLALAMPVLQRLVRPARLAWGAVAVLGVLVLFAAVTAAPLSGSGGSDEASRDGVVVSTLTRQLTAKLKTDRRYGLEVRGLTAYLSIEPGLLRSLDQHGMNVRLAYQDEQAYGSGWTRTDNPGGMLVLVSGEGQAVPPIGNLVARSEAHGRARTDLEPAILRGVARMDRIELAPEARELLRDVLAQQAATPEQRALLRNLLGAEPTVDGIEKAFQHPARLVQRGVIAGLLETGGLGYLAEHDLVLDMPADLKAEIVTYERARVDAESTTSVYLVPKGQPTS